MQRRKSDEYSLRLYNFYIGGLVAIILVLLQTLLGLEPLDLSIKISVPAFAIALPLLAGMLVVNIVEEKYPYGHARSVSARFMSIAFTIGSVATLVGIDAAFWHVMWQAGVAFLIALMAAVTVYGWYVAELEEEEPTYFETIEAVDDTKNTLVERKEV